MGAPGLQQVVHVIIVPAGAGVRDGEAVALIERAEHRIVREVVRDLATLLGLRPTLVDLGVLRLPVVRLHDRDAGVRLDLFRDLYDLGLGRDGWQRGVRALVQRGDIHRLARVQIGLRHLNGAADAVSDRVAADGRPGDGVNVPAVDVVRVLAEELEGEVILLDEVALARCLLMLAGVDVEAGDLSAVGDAHLNLNAAVAPVPGDVDHRAGVRGVERVHAVRRRRHFFPGRRAGEYAAELKVFGQIQLRRGIDQLLQEVARSVDRRNDRSGADGRARHRVHGFLELERRRKAHKLVAERRLLHLGAKARRLLKLLPAGLHRGDIAVQIKARQHFDRALTARDGELRDVADQLTVLIRLKASVDAAVLRQLHGAELVSGGKHRLPVAHRLLRRVLCDLVPRQQIDRAEHGGNHDADDRQHRP